MACHDGGRRPQRLPGGGSHTFRLWRTEAAAEARFACGRFNTLLGSGQKSRWLKLRRSAGARAGPVFEVETGKLFGSSKVEKAVATARKLLAAYSLVETALI